MYCLCRFGFTGVTGATAVGFGEDFGNTRFINPISSTIVSWFAGMFLKVLF